MPASQDEKNKPTLYALLVGITDYESHVRLARDTVKFPKLRGCIEDVRKIRRCVERNEHYNVEIQCLTNQAATKTAIATAMLERADQASEQDVILFYYSGHGTQEVADAVWSGETDKKLECLVCYYDEVTKEDCLLSDKELRKLIWELSERTGALIITIFDCCHSAGITRNEMRVGEIGEEAVEKRIPFAFPQRKWSDFLFGAVLSREEVQQKGEFAALPEGTHIEFSACLSNESAVELAGEGVFTKALLKVLDSTGGEISYQGLHRRIKQFLKGIYQQQPNLYVANPPEDLLFARFLHRPSDGIDLSMVETFRADLPGLQSKALNLYLDAGKAPVGELNTLLEALTLETGDLLFLAEEEIQSQYVLRYHLGYYFITLPEDYFRPLTEIIEGGAEDWVSSIRGQLRHMAAWNFLRYMQNANAAMKLMTDTLRVEIAAGIPLSPLPAIGTDNSPIVIDLVEEVRQLFSRIKISLTNDSGGNLFCCVVYLTSNFQSFTGFLDPAVYHLGKNESVTLNLCGKEELDIIGPRMMEAYNWEKTSDCLRLICSADGFDSTGLDLPPLPEPQEWPDFPGGSLTWRTSRPVARGIETEIPAAPENKSWRIIDIPVLFRNPGYDPDRRTNFEIFCHPINTLNMERDVQAYIEALELEAPVAFFEGYQERGPVVTAEGIEQSFVSNKSLVSFASAVSPQYRNDVLDSTLMAQLAANKKFPGEENVLNWYKCFIEVLMTVGWIGDESDFTVYEAKGNVFEVKDAVISILTAAFGSTFINIITKTLNSIKGLADTDGKIIAFKKNTQFLNKGCFQIALAVQENDTVALQLGTFLLESRNNSTQILFFKSTSDITTLTYNSRKVTLHTGQYNEKVRQAISKKLGDAIEENIAEIDI